MVDRSASVDAPVGDDPGNAVERHEIFSVVHHGEIAGEVDVLRKRCRGGLSGLYVMLPHPTRPAVEAISARYQDGGTAWRTGLTAPQNRAGRRIEPRDVVVVPVAGKQHRPVGAEGERTAGHA